MRNVRSLFRDSSGATVVEFALVAPVLLMTLFGIFDMGHGMYTKAMLLGAIEKAARDSTIQSATTGGLDTEVTSLVRKIAPNAAVTFTRSSYANFTNVGQPEDYSDVNGDGSCDNGEPYEDANDNGSWDADRGRTGNGGARDAVLYQVTVTYPRLFPIARIVGQPGTITMRSATVLRNQPFGLQGSGVQTRNCT